MTNRRSMASIAAIAGLAAIGVTTMPHDAKAWWRGGFGVGIVVPPVVVAPPVYAPPPVYVAPPVAPPVAYVPPPGPYYIAPRRVWIPPHWEGPHWVVGHWS